MKTLISIAAIILIGAGVVFFINKDNSKKANTETVSVSPLASQGLNPEHGQPNHRCDLPVGAPLNPVIDSAALNTAGAPKTNPAHGMPGHRCDLPVGAAL
ncbi:MAG TPA: hypothetical protein VEV16_08960 [Daejeonella sp.]|nr:hypothetical protein [Daejeonella sp.]